MNKIEIENLNFEKLFDEKVIDRTVNRLAKKISKDYEHKELLIISVLKGSFMFTSDLVKKLTIPCEVEFVKITSYTGTQSTENVFVQTLPDRERLLNRNIIIVEDIVDTGNTLNYFLPILKQYNPTSIQICTLLHKPEVFRYDWHIAYKGWDIEKEFVVGYGMDYNEIGRGLPCIYRQKEK